MNSLSKFEAQYILNEKLHQLADRLMKNELPDSKDKFFLFTVFILGKSFKTHEAAMLLCKYKYGEDAFMLSRTLFELMITILYILADSTGERLMRYLDYDGVTRKEMLNYAVTKTGLLASINKTIDSGQAEADILASINSEYQRVMQKYGYDRGKGWSDKSIKDMAEEVGRGDAYKTIYKLQCMVGHTNARSMNEYIKKTEDGFIMNIGPNIELAETSLTSIFDFFVTIFEKASNQFGWNIEGELESLTREFTQNIRAV